MSGSGPGKKIADGLVLVSSDSCGVHYPSAVEIRGQILPAFRFQVVEEELPAVSSVYAL